MVTESPISLPSSINVTAHLVLAGFVLKELQEQGCPQAVCQNTDAAQMCQVG